MCKILYYEGVKKMLLGMMKYRCVFSWLFGKVRVVHKSGVTDK